MRSCLLFFWFTARYNVVGMILPCLSEKPDGFCDCWLIRACPDDSVPVPCYPRLNLDNLHCSLTLLNWSHSFCHVGWSTYHRRAEELRLCKKMTCVQIYMTVRGVLNTRPNGDFRDRFTWCSCAWLLYRQDVHVWSIFVDMKSFRSVV